MRLHVFRFVVILLATGSICGISIAQQGSDSLRLVNMIALDGVEGRIDHFAVSDDHSRLYVAALGNNTVEVIDLKTNKRLQSIGGFKEPQGLGFVADSGALVVASGQDGKCRIYDPAFKLVGAIDGLDDADNVRIDPRSKHVYVGCGNGALAVIDPARATKLAEIKLDGHPESFRLESNGPRIFVNVPSAHHVAVVDRQKRAVIATWPLKDAEANFPMALDEQHHRLFVGCRKPARLLVLDTETGKTVMALDCCGDTDDVFYDAASNRIYLSGGEGCITVINQLDADHYKLRQTVPTAPGARTSFFVPETRTFYLAVPHRASQSAEIRAYGVEPRK
jgi:YVTN family beta-propeller protein